MRNRLSLIALALLSCAAAPLAALAAPPTSAAVGDADSFGNKVVWIGVASTGGVTLASSCAPDPANPLGPDDRCVVLNAGGAPTSFTFPDLGRITLPGNSTNSLICHSATTIGSYSFSNTTAGSVFARFRARPLYRFESEVLRDPSLINRETGLPFGGGIDTGLTGPRDFQTLAAGAQQTHNLFATRNCIGGLLTKASLVEFYGLTEAQAKKVFDKPITIRVGMTGEAAWVSDATILIGTRFTGDDK